MSGGIRWRTEFQVTTEESPESTCATVVMLQGAEDFFQMIDRFHDAIDEHIDNYIKAQLILSKHVVWSNESEPMRDHVLNIDRKALEKYRKRLKTFDAIRTLTIIWKETYVSETHTEMAGFKKRSNGCVNANWMATQLVGTEHCNNRDERYAKHAALRKRVKDTADAARELGFLEHLPEESDGVPLVATEKLNNLMEDIHLVNAVELYESYGGKNAK